MGLLKQLTKTALDVVTAPVDVVKDVATMGGLCTDQDEPYTWKKLKKIAKDVDEIPDSVDDGVI